MKLPSLNSQSVFTKHMVRSAVVALLLSLTLGSAIILTVPVSSNATVSMIETNLIPASPTSTVKHESLANPFDGVLLNATPFTGANEWSSEIVGLHWSSQYTFTRDQDGLTIATEQAVLSFWTEINVCMRNLTSLTISTELVGKTGHISSYLWVSVKRHGSMLEIPKPDSVPDLAEYTTATNLTESTEVTLKADVPLATIRNATDDWILQVNVHLNFMITSHSSFTIKRVLAQGSYSVPVSPVKIDAITTRGEKYFSNPLSQLMFPLPFINITKEATQKYSTVFLTHANSTLFLPIANYTGVAGWHVPSRYNETTTVSFEVQSGQRTLLTPEFPTLRLDIDTTPEFPWLRLTVKFRDPRSSIFMTEKNGLRYSYIYFDSFQCFCPESTWMFIPAIDGDLLISFEVWDYNIFGDLPPTQFFEQSISGRADLTLSIKLPYFAFAGFLLSTGELIVLVLIIAVFIVAFVITWRNTEEQVWTRIWKNPRIFPLVLMAIGIFTPWFSISIPAGTQLTSRTIEYLAFIPLLTLLIWTQGSMIPPSSIPLWPALPVVVLTLYLPTLYLVSSLKDTNPWNHTLQFVYSLIAPAFLAVLMMVFVIMAGIPAIAHIGLYACLIVPLAWLMTIAGDRIRKGKNEAMQR